jgi:hypothetical protein
MTGFDLAHKEAVKALPGATYADGAWLVPILHLPLLKAIFDTTHADPAVVAAYHELLRRMLDDLAGSSHRKGALGQHISEVIRIHANGIAYITAAGWQPTQRPQTPRPAPPPTESGDSELSLLARSVRGAVKADARKAAMIAKRQQRRRTHA